MSERTIFSECVSVWGSTGMENSRCCCFLRRPHDDLGASFGPWAHFGPTLGSFEPIGRIMARYYLYANICTYIYYYTLTVIGSWPVGGVNLMGGLLASHWLRQPVQSFRCSCKIAANTFCFSNAQKICKLQNKIQNQISPTFVATSNGNSIKIDFASNRSKSVFVVMVPCQCSFGAVSA